MQFTDHLSLEWARGRVFESDVGAVLASNVREAGSVRVSSVTVKEERKGRPHGLNTVELLKVASSSLNIGPAHAMAVRHLVLCHVKSCHVMLCCVMLC